MIARQWTCKLKTGKNSDYEKFLKEEIIPELSKMDGFKNASIKKNLSCNEYMFTSEWENLESIKQFAGDDINQAVVKEKAKEMMLSFDKEVEHYEIVFRK